MSRKLKVTQSPERARSLLRSACVVLVVMLGWLGGVGSPALAHDPNLARWDVSCQDESVFITVRMSGSGIFSELKAQDPELDWDAMPSETYERHVRDFLVRAFEFREGERLLIPKFERLQLGHETSATLRLKRRQKAPLRSFALDLSPASTRKHQHHLVFVHSDDRRDRFMLHRSDGLVLRWASPMTSPSKG